MFGSHVRAVRSIDDARVRAESGRTAEETHLVALRSHRDVNPQRGQQGRCPQPRAHDHDRGADLAARGPDASNASAIGENGVDGLVGHDGGAELAGPIGEGDGRRGRIGIARFRLVGSGGEVVDSHCRNKGLDLRRRDQADARPQAFGARHVPCQILRLVRADAHEIADLPEPRIPAANDVAPVLEDIGCRARRSGEEVQAIEATHHRGRAPGGP